MASFLPALLAPVLFPILVVEELIPIGGMFVISIYALLIGFPLCFIFGSFILLSLEKLNLNKPLLVSCIGALMVSIPVLGYGVFLDNLRLGLFFVIIGGACGFLASRLSNSKKSHKHERTTSSL